MLLFNREIFFYSLLFQISAFYLVFSGTVRVFVVDEDDLKSSAKVGFDHELGQMSLQLQSMRDKVRYIFFLKTTTKQFPYISIYYISFFIYIIYSFCDLFIFNPRFQLESSVDEIRQAIANAVNPISDSANQNTDLYALNGDAFNESDEELDDSFEPEKQLLKPKISHISTKPLMLHESSEVSSQRYVVGIINEVIEMMSPMIKSIATVKTINRIEVIRFVSETKGERERKKKGGLISHDFSQRWGESITDSVSFFLFVSW